MQHHTQTASNNPKEIEHNKKANERYDVAEKVNKMIFQQKEFSE